MKLSLNRQAEVPLHDQIAEQIIFLIATGKLREGEQLPSVRALAQRLKIHHNTVSKAYKSLVSREWLSRERGARLQVAKMAARGDLGLDGLIDETIRRAQTMGFSIQELEKRVIERLSNVAPRYILVVDQEVGLRRIIREELEASLRLPVNTCDPKELAEAPGIATDAYLIAAETVLRQLDTKSLKLRNFGALVFGSADEHLNAIRSLKRPSSVAIVSYSPRLLRAARAVISPILGEQHSFVEFLLPARSRSDFRAVDLLFCDSLAFNEISARNKRQYRLLDGRFLSKIEEWFFEPRVVGVRPAWNITRNHSVPLE